MAGTRKTSSVNVSRSAPSHPAKADASYGRRQREDFLAVLAMSFGKTLELEKLPLGLQELIGRFAERAGIAGKEYKPTQILQAVERYLREHSIDGVVRDFQAKFREDLSLEHPDPGLVRRAFTHFMGEG